MVAGAQTASGDGPGDMKHAVAALMLCAGGMAAFAQVPAPTDAPATPVSRLADKAGDSPRRPKAMDAETPPMYQGSMNGGMLWSPGFGPRIGACCHEGSDGQLYCHGVGP